MGGRGDLSIAALCASPEVENFSREENREVILEDNVPMSTQKCSASQYGGQFSPNSGDDFSVLLVTVSNQGIIRGDMSAIILQANERVTEHMT